MSGAGATVAADSLADFYTTVLNALSLQARDGADSVALGNVVDVAMTAWDAATRI
ncbi:hypothetical protein [Streptomyces sp. NPDC002790]|uniref:hypothetical protein n=1 Tax=Streptomyces sp. NPDC002790 TaxID=3154431 RepID=UPI00332F4060